MELSGASREDNPAMAMHDRLGEAGRAARVENPQRMVERQPFGLERSDLGIVPPYRLAKSDGSGHVGFAEASGDAEQSFDTRQLTPNFGHRSEEHTLNSSH